MRTSAEDQFDRAEHVFVARITSVHDRNPEHYVSRFSRSRDWNPNDETYGFRIEYEVEHVIKGNPADVPHLTTGYGAGDCGVRVFPGEVQLIAVDESGHFGGCGMNLELTGRDCREVHLLDRMKRRAAGAATPIEWPSVGPDYQEVRHSGDAYALLESGIGPWNASPDDCRLPKPMPADLKVLDYE